MSYNKFKEYALKLTPLEIEDELSILRMASSEGASWKDLSVMGTTIIVSSRMDTLVLILKDIQESASEAKGRIPMPNNRFKEYLDTLNDSDLRIESASWYAARDTFLSNRFQSYAQKRIDIVKEETKRRQALKERTRKV
jgi:hypothetical protein